MKLLKLLERLNNLKQIPRTGWSLCGVPLSEVEDVAQHTFDVATITLLLANELDLGTRLNPERALSMAILHDWAEVEVADFPYAAMKHLGSASMKNIIEKSALEDLLVKLPNKKKYLELWREYSENRTKEAKLVHAADYLSMLLQALRYREGKNRSRKLNELWHAVKEDLKPYTEEFPPLKKLIAEFEISQRCF